jgi:DeoR family glycerol-3-phosphate regulon repressor
VTGTRSHLVEHATPAEAAKVSERRAAILEAVRANGAVSVSELAERFAVTQQTIRRDLHSLDSRGLLQKGFGGAFASPGVAKLTIWSVRGVRPASSGASCLP